MPDFTKGNWVFWKNKKYPYWYVGKEGSERYIATVDKEANARLIAAAPEMYELLKVWVQIQAQPTLRNAQDKAQELLARIDGKEEQA